jgi:hypothetical protein
MLAAAVASALAYLSAASGGGGSGKQLGVRRKNSADLVAACRCFAAERGSMVFE